MERISKFVPLFHLFIVFFQAGFSQKYTTKNYQVRDGLPSTEVYQAFQDSKGFIWFATDAGVSRFDGYAFKNFTTENGLPDNTILHIYEDKYGRIWFSSFTGQLAYFENGNVIAPEVNRKLKALLTRASHISFCMGPNDTLYIGGMRLDKRIRISSPYGEEDLLVEPLPPFSHLVYDFGDSSQRMWISNEMVNMESTFILQLGTVDAGGKITAFDPDTATLGTFCRLIKLRNGNYIFSVDGDIYLGNAKEKKLSLILKKRPVSDLYEDRDGNIWISTVQDGVHYYRGGDISRPPLRIMNFTGCSSVLQDKEGGYWFTTLEKGVFYLPSLDITYFDSESGISGNKINSVQKLDDSTVVIIPQFKNLHLISANGKIDSRNVSGWNLNVVDPGKKLLFINGAPCLLYDISKDRVIKISDAKSGNVGYLNKVVIEEGNNFVGISKAGFIADVSQNGLMIPRSVFKNRIMDLFIDSKKRYWMACSDGLKEYRDGKLLDPPGKNKLLEGRIEKIAELPGGTLLLATKGNGLIFYDGRTRKLDVTQGLPSNICKAIYIDKDGILWVGTNNGLCKIVLENDKITRMVNYSTSNGLVSNEINEIARTGDVIWVATSEGLVRFDVKKKFSNMVSPPVYITGIKTNRHFFSSDSMRKFGPGENSFIISFIGLSYRSPGKIVYKYRLAGLDTNWSYTNSLAVQYTTLPPGDYRFEIIAITNEGAESARPAAFSFFISRPFWQEWWFLVSAFLIISFSVWFVYKMRVRNIQTREEEKTRLKMLIVEKDLKALRAQMNPHFMFNALNSIQNFILKNDSATAQKYLSKFAKLIRLVLENSNHEMVPIGNEMTAIQLYVELEALRSSFSFDYKMEISPDLKQEPCYIAPMIIQPFVENAILHGLLPLEERRGELYIGVDKQQEFLKITIEDNGIGRAKAREYSLQKKKLHRSMGMEVTRDRLELLAETRNLEQQIAITDKVNETGIAAGTKIELFLPFKRVNYAQGNNY